MRGAESVLTLALRAEVRASAADHDLANGRSADPAWLAFAGVDAMFELEKTCDPFGVDVVRDRGAAKLDGALENIDERKAEML